MWSREEIETTMAIAFGVGILGFIVTFIFLSTMT